MFVHLTYLVLSSATLSKWDILCSLFLIKNHHVVFVPSTTVDRISFCNHRNRKVVGGKHNVLLIYVDVRALDPSGVVLYNPFFWDIMYSTPAKWIPFCNHKNRKVVGGKHNVLVLYVNASAPNPSGVVICNPFKWDILWFISDWKSCYLCAYPISKTNFIPQPHEQKSCRRQTQCSNRLCES